MAACGEVSSLWEVGDGFRQTIVGGGVLGALVDDEDFRAADRWRVVACYAGICVLLVVDHSYARRPPLKATSVAGSQV